MKQIDFDPSTGVATYHDFNEVSGETIIHRRQDFMPHLEANKELYKDEGYGADGKKKEWWHVASIPNLIIEKWLVEDGIDAFNPDHMPAVKRKLHDPDYRHLRVSAGRF